MKKEWKIGIEIVEARELFSKSVLLKSGYSIDVVEVTENMVKIAINVRTNETIRGDLIGLSPLGVKQLHEILGEYLESKKELIEEDVK